MTAANTTAIKPLFDFSRLPDTAQGFNVTLMGPAGTGKTHALGTLVDTGMEVFALFTESGVESLQGLLRRPGPPYPRQSPLPCGSGA